MTRCHECNQRPEDGCMFGCQTARAIEAEAERDALRTRAEEAERKLAEAREVLRIYEWGGLGGCSMCLHDIDEGHAPDCRLAKVLGEGT